VSCFAFSGHVLCFCHVCVLVLPFTNFPQSLFFPVVSSTHFTWISSLSCLHSLITLLCILSPGLFIFIVRSSLSLMSSHSYSPCSCQVLFCQVLLGFLNSIFCCAICYSFFEIIQVLLYNLHLGPLITSMQMQHWDPTSTDISVISGAKWW